MSPPSRSLTLVDKIKREGQEALAKGEQPDWTSVQIVKNIDYRQLGAAINGSEYSIGMAKRFLTEYKFKGWAKHSSTGADVTDEDKRKRADEVARALCSNERWKIHAHALTRDVIWSELRIHVDHPESAPGLERAMRRLWAMFAYILDRGAIAKLIISQEVSYVRTGVQIAHVLQ